MMKRTLTALATIGLLGFGASGAAAASLSSALNLADEDTLEDRDFEFVLTFDDQGGLVPFFGKLSDALANQQRVFLGGISVFETLNNVPLSKQGVSNALNEVTALFLTEVTAVQFANNGLDAMPSQDDQYHVDASPTGLTLLNQVFDIDASVQPLLDTNTVALLFEDSSADFDVANPTVADAEDGKFIMSASLQDGDFFGATAIDDIGFVGMQGPNFSIGNFGFGLTIDNFLFGTLTGQVQFTNNALIGNPFVNNGGFFDLVGLDGTLKGSDSPGFAVESDIDVVFQAIPAPGTVGLLGLGLIGFGIAKRRRMRA